METHPYSEMTPEQQAFCIADVTPQVFSLQPEHLRSNKG